MSFRAFLEKEIKTIFTSLTFVGESVFLKGSITCLISVTKHQMITRITNPTLAVKCQVPVMFCPFSLFLCSPDTPPVCPTWPLTPTSE